MRTLHKLHKLIFIYILINFISLPIRAKCLTDPNLIINSKSAILMTHQTSSIIYEKNAYDKFYPASTTKILTAIVVLETLDLNERVEVSKKASSINGTKVGLCQGGLYTVEDLLYGLLLNSGNDCAIALAEHTCGSEENFSKLMNKKAKTIGAYYSNFVNASGLHNDKHYTCAYDLSKILSYAIKNKKFIEISTSKSHDILGTNGDSFNIYNQNQLILKNGKYYYEHALLGKTGFTTPAQYTFAASARNNNVDLIAVALKASSKDEYLQDIINLFNYGFSKIKKISISSK
ncbi:D-alanyl-D-alanine carboxypeptidase [Candidatus Arthromitus sp. SFB-mouse-NL]|uniref:D-alanyl-D-alanine carboxypeptidase family protein n=1 Tax=Candidatus Arthromitus sp. SFB-mouse-NL TaxID=1508644 RepID=UPI00049A8BC1|nr:D-alanyl-D-alanine carboxypeptidase family protein [Candidatus Arthromitus sp. SFB-mouse-NL]AID44374.1 D-alanyl-D-alanine carboxypeptidase [Candidatus Arthromitus sp. SFB-mouse-NL]